MEIALSPRKRAYAALTSPRNKEDAFVKILLNEINEKLRRDRPSYREYYTRVYQRNGKWRFLNDRNALMLESRLKILIKIDKNRSYLE